MDIRLLLTNSVSYWERLRIVYNLVLATLVLACWGSDMLADLANPKHLLGGLIVLVIFAAIANALFCFAYPVDFVLQLVSVKWPLRRMRLTLFLSGLLLACALAIWVMLFLGTAT